MTFYPRDNGEGDGLTSKFNEASFKMLRFHQLQVEINKARINPLKQNETTGVYNFQMWINCLDSMMMEMIGKLSDEEKKEIFTKRKVIQTFLVNHPIINEKRNQINNTNILKIDYAVFTVLEQEIVDYEIKLQELKTRCGFDSPNNEDNYDGLI
jgi:hypothetical protein